MVLAPLPAVTTSCEMHDEDVDDGDVAAINAIAAATEGVLTLPGGPWNEVRGVCSLGYKSGGGGYDLFRAYYPFPV